MVGFFVPAVFVGSSFASAQRRALANHPHYAHHHRATAWPCACAAGRLLRLWSAGFSLPLWKSAGGADAWVACPSAAELADGSPALVAGVGKILGCFSWQCETCVLSCPWACGVHARSRPLPHLTFSATPAATRCCRRTPFRWPVPLAPRSLSFSPTGPSTSSTCACTTSPRLRAQTDFRAVGTARKSSSPWPSRPSSPQPVQVEWFAGNNQAGDLRVFRGR